MVGSFIVFAIALILKLIFSSLENKFTILQSISGWMTLAVVATAVIFVVFVVVSILGKIFSKK